MSSVFWVAPRVETINYLQLANYLEAVTVAG
jgi:hypothetical protein